MIGGWGDVTKFNVNVSTEKIKKFLMDKIDSCNPVEVEKVGRYISLIDMHRRMSKTVKKEGESTKVVNGSQEYIKAHPLLTEMNKVNASLLSIEKTFVFVESVNEDENEEVELI